SGARHRQAAGRPAGGGDPEGQAAGAVQGQGHPLQRRADPAQSRQGRI
ncbi:MAG: LSU ribosomal protein L6p (L9e), partial [uncultured Rubrobacteraceae bacterium]